MAEPTPTTAQPPDPAAGATPLEPAPGAQPPDDEGFTSDRQRRRFAELTGRVGVRERERDEARQRVEQLLTREAERVAAASLSQPTDLWLEGAHLADLLSDDGSDVDPAKVRGVIDGLITARPGLAKQPEPRPLSGVHRPGQAERPKATFADAVHRIARGREGL